MLEEGMSNLSLTSIAVALVVAMCFGEAHLWARCLESWWRRPGRLIVVVVLMRRGSTRFFREVVIIVLLAWQFSRRG